MSYCCSVNFYLPSILEYYIDEDPVVAKSYQFADDRMIIDYDGTAIVQYIPFRKDTLVMKNEFGKINCFVPVKIK